MFAVKNAAFSTFSRINPTNMKVRKTRFSHLTSRVLGLNTYPPKNPLMVIPSDTVWLAEQAEVNELRDAAVAVQRRFDEKSVRNMLQFQFGYSSNKIDGHFFTEAEVLQFIQTGRTIAGKTLREHAEIENHHRAVTKVLQSVNAPLRDVTSVDFALDLHKICMPAPRYDTDDVIPGQFKTHDNMVITIAPDGKTRMLRQFVSPVDAPVQLQELMQWCRDNHNQVPILPFITIFHYNFTRIGPFPTSNGRIGRLLTMLYMLRRDYPPMIIDAGMRDSYQAALSHADFHGDLAPLVKFFSRTIKDTYRDIIQLKS